MTWVFRSCGVPILVFGLTAALPAFSQRLYAIPTHTRTCDINSFFNSCESSLLHIIYQLRLSLVNCYIHPRQYQGQSGENLAIVSKSQHQLGASAVLTMLTTACINFPITEPFLKPPRSLECPCILCRSYRGAEISARRENVVWGVDGILPLLG